MPTTFRIVVIFHRTPLCVAMLNLSRLLLFWIFVQHNGCIIHGILPLIRLYHHVLLIFWWWSSPAPNKWILMLHTYDFIWLASLSLLMRKCAHHLKERRSIIWGHWNFIIFNIACDLRVWVRKCHDIRGIWISSRTCVLYVRTPLRRALIHVLNDYLMTSW